jgi:hypothetical protein
MFFDDEIPAEQQPFVQKFIAQLRQATPPVSSMTAEDQSQILTRVQARLQQAEHEIASKEEAAFQQEDLKKLSLPSPLRETSSRRVSGGRHLLEIVAAVFVVGVLIGGAFLLFTPHQSTSGIPLGATAGATKPPVTIRTQAGGLEMSLRTTAGPYFLSELLATDIILTNHSQKSLVLQGDDLVNYCTGAFSVTTTGGNDPHYDFPPTPPMSCPFTSTKLAAGQTLVAHGYIPLAKSGSVTVTVNARVLTVSNDGSLTGGPDPFDGHWPSLHIQVASKIPADRLLSVQRQGSHLTIDAPPSVQSSLLYTDSSYCGNSSFSTQGGQWRPVKGSMLQEPSCSGGPVRWTYAIGVPGYAIASGQISS